MSGSTAPGTRAGSPATEIPLEGRIAAVADVFVALTRDRVYRPRLSRAAAREVMHDGRRSDFDPDVLDAFLTVDHRLAQEMAGPEVGLPSALGSTAGGSAPPRRSRRASARCSSWRPTAARRRRSRSARREPRTVKTHFQRIYAKLEARDRAAAVATGLRRGLID